MERSKFSADRLVIMGLRTTFRRYAVKIDEVVATSTPVFLSGLLENLLRQNRTSYSSFGEDVVVESIFRRHLFVSKEEIHFSYIDIGAWRPIRGSNTYKFYKSGIFGTIVEPNPELKRLWLAVRPKDLHLPFACSTDENIVFNQFSKLAPSNTANNEFAKEISLSQSINFKRTLNIEALSLDDIITLHLERFPGPFILDLDIEGDDGKVLNNFSFADLKRPLLILVEDHPKLNLSSSPIHKNLTRNNYKLVARSVITSIYIDSNSTLALSQYPIV